MGIYPIFQKPLKVLERFLQTDIQYLARGGFWLFVGSTAGMFIALILSVAYARYLPKEIYGNYRYILSIVSLVGIFSLPGVGTSITRAVARGYEKTFTKNGLIIFFSSFGISVACLIAALAFFYNNNTALAWGFIIAALLIPFVEGLGSWRAYLDGKKEFKKKAALNILVQIIYGALMLTSVLAIYFFRLSTTSSVALLISTYLATRGITNIFLFIINAKRVPQDAAYEKGSLKYGLHMSASGIPSTIAAYIDGVLLFLFFGPAHLAVYSFAIALPEQLKKLFTNIAATTFPKLASKIPNDEMSGDFKRTFPKKIFKATIVTGGLILLYIIAAPIIYKVFFPRYFLESTRLSQIFALSLILFPFGVFGNAIKAEGNIKKIYIYNIGVPLFQIAALVVLIPIFGLWGAILGRVAGRLSNHVLAFILFRVKL